MNLNFFRNLFFSRLGLKSSSDMLSFSYTSLWYSSFASMRLSFLCSMTFLISSTAGLSLREYLSLVGLTSTSAIWKEVGLNNISRLSFFRPALRFTALLSYPREERTSRVSPLSFWRLKAPSSSVIAPIVEFSNMTDT